MKCEDDTRIDLGGKVQNKTVSIRALLDCPNRDGINHCRNHCIQINTGTINVQNDTDTSVQMPRKRIIRLSRNIPITLQAFHLYPRQVIIFVAIFIGPAAATAHRAARRTDGCGTGPRIPKTITRAPHLTAPPPLLIEQGPRLFHFRLHDHWSRPWWLRLIGLRLSRQ